MGELFPNIRLKIPLYKLSKRQRQALSRLRMQQMLGCMLSCMNHLSVKQMLPAVNGGGNWENAAVALFMEVVVMVVVIGTVVIMVEMMAMMAEVIMVMVVMAATIKF